ncbi:MAG: hypothetical protein WCT50_04680 [Patescibacteria group bacterium]
MNILSSLYHFDEKKLKNLLKRIFRGENWLKIFLDDSHHGFTHGNQVRLSCLKLIENLTLKEKKKLQEEGKKICAVNSHQYAIVAIEIAAIFHDCGRFNETGQVIAEEQKYHHILSAKRAEIFCANVGLNIIIPNVKEAILCHDFQNKRLTPELTSPKSIIGKIVQSSDQMGWFHPNSIARTLAFNKALGSPFYNPQIPLKERLIWAPGVKEARDSLTVMLGQLFGPTKIERFGIEFARKKIEIYKVGLENNIIKMAEEYKVKKEVEILIENFRKRKKR